MEAFVDVADAADAADAGENAEEEDAENPPPLTLSPLATRASARATRAVVSLEREEDLCLLMDAAACHLCWWDAALRTRSIVVVVAALPTNAFLFFRNF